MSVTAEVRSGPEGVVAFAAEIAEPAREGGALRHRECIGPAPRPLSELMG